MKGEPSLPWKAAKVNNSLSPTWKPKGSQLICPSSSGTCSEQNVLPTRQVATVSPSKLPLRTALSRTCCCTLKWQSEELHHISHPKVLGPANAYESLLFGFAANRAQQIPWTLSSIYKPMALHSQSLNLWLLPCSNAFTSSHPARLPSPRHTSSFLLLLRYSLGGCDYCDLFFDV